MNDIIDWPTGSHDRKLTHIYTHIQTHARTLIAWHGGATPLHCIRHDAFTYGIVIRKVKYGRNFIFTGKY